jgi:prolipoprotein diacylglyceryltransferase
VLKTNRSFDGAWFGLFVALYSAARLLIEAFQGDSETIGGLRIAQVWSLIVLLLMLALLRRWARSSASETSA